jgi:hypothetical protein
VLLTLQRRYPQQTHGQAVDIMTQGYVEFNNRGSGHRLPLLAFPHFLLYQLSEVLSTGKTVSIMKVDHESNPTIF